MRRKYFSARNKVFCSTSNFELSQYLKKHKLSEKRINRKEKLLQKSLQYCYYNSKPIDGEILFHNDKTIFKQYIINNYFQ